MRSRPKQAQAAINLHWTSVNLCSEWLCHAVSSKSVQPAASHWLAKTNHLQHLHQERGSCDNPGYSQTSPREYCVTSCQASTLNYSAWFFLWGDFWPSVCMHTPPPEAWSLPPIPCTASPANKSSENLILFVTVLISSWTESNQRRSACHEQWLSLFAHRQRAVFLKLSHPAERLEKALLCHNTAWLHIPRHYPGEKVQTRSVSSAKLLNANGLQVVSAEACRNSFIFSIWKKAGQVRFEEKNSVFPAMSAWKHQKIKCRFPPLCQYSFQPQPSPHQGSKSTTVDEELARKASPKATASMVSLEITTDTSDLWGQFCGKEGN